MVHSNRCCAALVFASTYYDDYGLRVVVDRDRVNPAVMSETEFPQLCGNAFSRGVTLTPPRAHPETLRDQSHDIIAYKPSTISHSHNEVQRRTGHGHAALCSGSQAELSMMEADGHAMRQCGNELSHHHCWTLAKGSQEAQRLRLETAHHGPSLSDMSHVALAQARPTCDDGICHSSIDDEERVL